MFAELYVVTAVSNPERYKSRYRLYRAFEKHCMDSGAKLYTVEAAFGERPHELTVPNNPCHIQLRTSSQLWHKENLINIGISRLPSTAKYVAWIDSDVMFARPDWVSETIHQLQHFNVVQIFTDVNDLAPDYSKSPQFYSGSPKSWAGCYANGEDYAQRGNKGGYGLDETTAQGNYWHPGFAWAARLDVISALGGLMDFHVIGAADYLMAICMTDVCEIPTYASIGNVGRWVKEWRERCRAHVRHNVGAVSGLILHHWHGKKTNRQYVNRQSILLDNGFDPELDLKRDWQGLWQLTDRNPKLRNGIRRYFRSRNEDSIDVV